jgi:alkyldihydroxyacetonephosphate synthase
VDVVRALQRVFDPGRILNPGNLVPSTSTSTSTSTATSTASASAGLEIDRASLLASIPGSMLVVDAEGRLVEDGLTLDLSPLPSPSLTIDEWLARGAPGTRDRWLDPADQLLAGLAATMRDGRALVLRPAPRRAAGPDLVALVVGCGGRFVRIDAAWLRVHRVGVARPSAAFSLDRDPPMDAGERALVDAVLSLHQPASWAI